MNRDVQSLSVECNLVRNGLILQAEGLEKIDCARNDVCGNPLPAKRIDEGSQADKTTSGLHHAIYYPATGYGDGRKGQKNWLMLP
jgi:hypothetical protein